MRPDLGRKRRHRDSGGRMNMDWLMLILLLLVPSPSGLTWVDIPRPIRKEKEEEEEDSGWIPQMSSLSGQIIFVYIQTETVQSGRRKEGESDGDKT